MPERMAAEFMARCGKLAAALLRDDVAVLLNPIEEPSGDVERATDPILLENLRTGA